MINNYFPYFFAILFINLLIYIFRIKLFDIFNIKDKPDNILKKHNKSVYPLGGIFFFFSIITILILDIFTQNSSSFLIGLSKSEKLSFAFGVISCFLIGLYDDKYNLKYNIKIFLFIIVIYICITLDPNLVITNLNFSYYKETIYLGHLSKFFTILCIFIFINAFNLFDGIDLQSGIYTLSILTIFYILTKELFFLLMILPNIFFLVLNKKKELFLGDSGTILIGFVISYFSIKLYSNSLILCDEIFILMMIPGLDMLRLFLIRIIKGKNPFVGDRQHLHHIMLEKYGYKNTILFTHSVIIISFILMIFSPIKSYLIIAIVLFLYIIFIHRRS